MRIGVHGLGVRFGAAEVLRGIELEVAPGEVLAVLGANGAGKSTLLRAIAGVQPHRGQVRWNGAASRPASGIGYMPQDNATSVALSVFEVVLLGRLRSLGLRVAPADLAAAEAALAELGIRGLASRRLGELSGGQRQLVFLAQVLAGNPQALLLDEPTSALDIAHQVQVLGLIGRATRRRGLTTLAVLHDINAAARFADRIALLCDGRLAACGPPAQVLCPALLRAAYGVEVAVMTGPDGRPVVLPLPPVENE
ncbi:MAG: ABC transporter ATP-binding protein [Acetobacteraceae bacterium]|nr:ABC transporter ATP-binding protein [Acetobacteraceae bacterium]